MPVKARGLPHGPRFGQEAIRLNQNTRNVIGSTAAIAPPREGACPIHDDAIISPAAPGATAGRCCGCADPRWRQAPVGATVNSPGASPGIRVPASDQEPREGRQTEDQRNRCSAPDGAARVGGRSSPGARAPGYKTPAPFGAIGNGEPRCCTHAYGHTHRSSVFSLQSSVNGGQVAFFGSGLRRSWPGGRGLDVCVAPLDRNRVR